MKPPVFIVGSGRCGTTLLYSMLISSGSFAVYRSEVMTFDRIAPAYGNFKKTVFKKRFLNKWLSSEHFLRTGLEPDLITQRLMNGCHSPFDFQKILMESIVEEQGAERWCDCTPLNICFMPALKRYFPDAKFIHIYRDGRDVALSMVKTNWIKPLTRNEGDSLISAALSWESIVDTGARLGRKLEKDYMEVRFEELINDPRAELEKIGAFIDHELDYSRILSLGLGSVGNPNSSFSEDKTSSRLGFINRWKAGCTPGELKRIESLIYRGLTSYGYVLSQPAMSRDISPRDSLIRKVHRARFISKHLVKTFTPVGRLSTPALDEGWGNVEEGDKTFRPSLYPEYIHDIVAFKP